MARGVDEVQHVRLAVARGVVHSRGVELDGDAALAFDVHGVQELRLHVPIRDGSRAGDEGVGQGGLAVVDVRDD